MGSGEPQNKPIEKVRDIRDEIERKTKELVDEMGKKENTAIV